MNIEPLKQTLSYLLREGKRRDLFLYFVQDYTKDNENNLIEVTFDYKKIFIYTALIPAVLILVDSVFGNLGSNPQQALHIRLGDWSLRFLCLTLLITPIQKITRWRGMSVYRQLFGLFAFFYASLHVLGYLIADHMLAWDIIYLDVTESPFIWFGLFAYIVILLLAMTSSNKAKKMMGKTWKKLHRWIYPASIGALIHYFWQLKGNLIDPVFYSAIVFILLMFRVLVWLKNRQLTRLMVPKGPVDID